MRIRLLTACVVIPLLLWGLVPVISGAQSSDEKLSQLEKKIDRAREKIGKKKGTERVLAVDIQAYSKRISRLQGKIDVLQGRQSRLQADLDRNETELDALRDALRAERARLTRLRARLTVARRALSTRLIHMYKASKPDMLTVILDSNGFEQLLERTEFLRRISRQDGDVIRLVQSAKVDAAATESKLDRLETRQQKVTAVAFQRREEVRVVKDELVGTRVGFDRTRAGKKAALITVRGQRQHAEEDLAAMERAQGKIRTALLGVQGTVGTAGPVKRGSGQLIWPANAPVSSPFGARWGRLHAGIDLPLAEGTPLRAAASGKVAIAGWVGGYGNYTCIQHAGSLSTCYGHQSRLGARVGQDVRQGQVIGYSGNTGHSTGPHLHFETRINGNPVDPMGFL